MQIRAAEARQFANIQAEYEKEMQRAKEVYATTLKLVQQQFEIKQQRLEIQRQRLQLREQSFNQSFKRQVELDQKVKALQANNAARKEANRRELALLHEQLLQINLKNDGEAAYAEAQPDILERKSRVFAEWKFAKSRKLAFRMEQLYKEYAVDGVSADDTMAAFLTTFCDHCLKSSSASEDYSSKHHFRHSMVFFLLISVTQDAKSALKLTGKWKMQSPVVLTTCVSAFVNLV